MVKSLLDEARSAPLDEAGRARLREIYEISIAELSGALSPDLGTELSKMALPFSAEVPTESELRIAQAQLVGWLEGLFHGIQASLFAQQAAAAAQLEKMRDRSLPPGAGEPRAGHVPLARAPSHALTSLRRERASSSSRRERDRPLMAEGFVHLHNHTEYSMLDGAARVEEMVLAAKADGQRAIAITDHGNLYGVIDFYETCRKHDMTPIIGLEAYMAANSRFDRPPRRGKIDDTGGETEGGQKLYHHLTLLATLQRGLPQPARTVVAGVPRGVLLQAPPRLGPPRALQRRDSSRPRAASAASSSRRCLHDDYPKALELAGRLQTHLRPRELLHRAPGPRHTGTGAHEPATARDREGAWRAAGGDERPALRAPRRRRDARRPALHRHRLAGRGPEPLPLPQRPALPEVGRRDALPLSRPARGL